MKRRVEDASTATVRIDIQLNFEKQTVGIEAKLDHELTRDQVRDQRKARGEEATLVVLLPKKDVAPSWLADFPDVGIVGWEETLGSFDDPRLG